MFNFIEQLNFWLEGSSSLSFIFRHPEAQRLIDLTLILFYGSITLVVDWNLMFAPRCMDFRRNGEMTEHQEELPLGLI